VDDAVRSREAVSCCYSSEMRTRREESAPWRRDLEKGSGTCASCSACSDLDKLETTAFESSE
jgi:hypothetical protein